MAAGFTTITLTVGPSTTISQVVYDNGSTQYVSATMLTDGAGHSMPAGDASARAVFHKTADGDDAAQGAVADAAATAGGTGTVSAKLRLLTSQMNTQAGYLDGLETLLTAIDGHVDGLEGLLGGTGSVTAKPQSGALTNKGGKITSGGTSQELAATNSSRKYLFVQNISAEELYVNIGATATDNSSTQDSIVLPPASTAGKGDGGVLVFEGSFVPTGAVNIIGATTDSAFVAKEG